MKKPLTGASKACSGAGGGMMQVWSNNVYQAPVQRVLAKVARDHNSLPFFFNPSATTRVSPLPTVVSDQNPSLYNTVEWAWSARCWAVVLVGVFMLIV